MLKLNKEQLNEIKEHAKVKSEHESCGILAGMNGVVQKVYKMKNISETPGNCYFMEPQEQLKVMKEIRGLGLEMVGIYHTHPITEAYPSDRDIELAYYPDTTYVIVSLVSKENPKVRAFRIVDGKVSEEAISV